MGTWTGGHTCTTTTPAEQIWERWTDAQLWPEDDPDTAAAYLDAPLEWTTGWVKPSS